MEYNGHIYCIICLPTEKWYFGQTVGSISDRWIRHLSSVKKGSDHKFHRAIRKYGEENFLVEEVMFVEASTKEALSRRNSISLKDILFRSLIRRIVDITRLMAVITVRQE